MNAMAESMVRNGRGAGRDRDKWEIRKHLDSLGSNGTLEAKKIGIYPRQFNETINGIQNNRKALKHMVDLGIDRDVLSLPEDIRGYGLDADGAPLSLSKDMQ